MTATYDNHLSFQLPYNYETDTGINDEGQKYFSILCGTSLNNDGEKAFDLRVMVRSMEGQINREKADLKAAVPATDMGTISEMSFGLQLGSSKSSSNRSLVFQILIYIVAVSGDDCTYTLVATRSGRESSFDENTGMIAEHMNRILEGMTIDGKGIHAEEITAWHVQQKLRERSASKDGTPELDLVHSKSREENDHPETLVSKKYNLTYHNGVRKGSENYSIAIPDQFRVQEHTDGRDFIAWLPGDDPENHFEGKIIFYAGKEIPKGDIDTRIMTPELCCLAVEELFQNNPVYQGMYQSSVYIPLKEKYPAGGIYACFDEDNYAYYADVFFPGSIKTMRVQFMDVEGCSRSECNQIVVEWMNTMICNQPFESVRILTDPFFTACALTEELAEEWKKASDAHFTIVVNTMKSKVRCCTALYKNSAGKEQYTQKEMFSDIQDHVNSAAKAMGDYLKEVLSSLETITAKNSGNPLLKDLYNHVCPAIVNGRSIAVNDPDGIKGRASARVPGFEDIKSRFLKLMPEAAEKIKQEEAYPAFVSPTYSAGKKVRVGDLVVSVPDHMIIAAEYHDSDESSESFLRQLRSRYCFVAIPDDFSKGFDFYTEGTFCLNINNPMQADQIAKLFGMKEEEPGAEKKIASRLLDFTNSILKQNGKADPRFPAEYLKGGAEYGIILVQTAEELEREEPFCSYAVLVYYGNALYQGNVYINASGARQQFEEAAKKWASMIEPAAGTEFETREEKKERLQKEAREKEEASRKAEEEARKRQREEAEKKYRADYAEWEEACKNVKGERIRLVKSRLAEEKENYENEARENHDRSVIIATRVIEEMEKMKGEAEEDLSKLSFFQFSEKSRQKCIIEEAGKKLEAAKKDLEKAEEEYRNLHEKMREYLDIEEKRIQTQVWKELPLPQKPVNPNRTLTVTQKENRGFKGVILDFLEGGGRYTITEIMESVPEIGALSNQRVASLLRQMTADGLIVREEIRRKAYFSIA